MKDYKEHIARCFEFVEQKLSKGKLDSWDTNDFKALSESIHKEAGTLLSVSTLKRLCGKVKYGSKPNTATLNALAQYVGFTDWRAFVESEKVDIHPVRKVPRTKRSMSRTWVYFLLALAVSSVIFLIFKNRTATYNSNDFAFEGKSVTTGLPNSVIFHYDATAAKEGALIEIQQNWDERKRVAVNKNDSVSTSIYYRPGYFKSKLVVDESIVKENDVFITTNNWLGMIEQEPRPIYLKNFDILKNGRMAITPEVVFAHNLDPRTSEIVVSFYQVKDFGGLYTDDFEMYASLKNDFKEGVSGACQRAEVYILYDGGAIGIPLSKKGCVSELTLMTFEGFLDGKKTDLSGFGVDFTDYIDLKCVSKNRKLNIMVGEKSVFTIDVPKAPKKIVGISIHFEGAGSVKNVVFKKNAEIVYTSTFKASP